MATSVNTPSMSGSINAVGKINASNVVSTFDKPVWDNYLYEKYPRYVMAPLLERLGRLEAIEQDVFYWAEIDRTRQVGTVTNNGGSPVTSGTPGTTVQVELDETTQYFIVGDVVETATNRLAVVTDIAVGTAIGGGGLTAGGQEIELEEIDGNNLTDADFPVGSKLVHRYNINPECSTSPESRVWQPEQKSNQLTTVRRKVAVCDFEVGNIQWVGPEGEGYWYSANQAYTEREFVIDKENVIMFGQTGTQTSTGAVSGYGIFPHVQSNGVVFSYAGAVTEDDVIDIITELGVYGDAEEYTVLCGNLFMRDITKALKDYFINGGVTYGAFAEAGMKVGLNVNQYAFNGKLVTFIEYPLFTDPNLNSGTGATIDYRNAALFLDMGVADNGEPLIKLKTKKNPFGGDEYFHAETGSGMPGMFGIEGGNAYSNGEACWYLHLYSRLGVQLSVVNRHGLMYKA